MTMTMMPTAMTDNSQLYRLIMILSNEPKNEDNS